MRCARPSTIAVLPTPGSPISTGLFFVRRREHLDHAADLLVAPDHRVELALLGELGQVLAEALQRLLLLLLGRRRRAAARRLSVWRCHRCSLCFGRWVVMRNNERASAARTISAPRRGRGRARRGRSGAPRSSSSASSTCACSAFTSSSSMRACISCTSDSRSSTRCTPGEIETELGRHLVDAAQLLDILLGVEARALRRALGLHQPTRLVHAQRLRMHVRKLRGNGDHEHAAVGLHLDARDASAAGVELAEPSERRVIARSPSCGRPPPAPRRVVRGGRRSSPCESCSTAASCSEVSVSGTSIDEAVVDVAATSCRRALGDPRRAGVARCRAGCRASRAASLTLRAWARAPRRRAAPRGS